MKSWTRTLNLDDAHTLLSLTDPGTGRGSWVQMCHEQMPHLSAARRREVIRLLRDGFLEWSDEGHVEDAPFLRFYTHSPAAAQVDLVAHQWALSHDLTLTAAEEVVAPALEAEDPDIPLDRVEQLVKKHLSTRSRESRRKTRTVLLGALEGIGTVATRGTGQHRSIKATRGRPHPVTFAYLIRRELRQRGAMGMMSSEVPESSIAVRLTRCTRAHADKCLEWSLEQHLLLRQDDEVAYGPRSHPGEA